MLNATLFAGNMEIVKRLNLVALEDIAWNPIHF